MTTIRTTIESLRARARTAYLRFLRLPPRTRLVILALGAIAILGSGFILVRSVVVAVASRGPAASQAIVVDFPDAETVIADAEAQFAVDIAAEDLATLPDTDPTCYLVLDDLTGTVVGEPDTDDRFEVLCGPVRMPGERNGSWLTYKGEVEVKRDGSATSTLLADLDPYRRAPYSTYDEFHSLINPITGEVVLQGDAGALDLGTDAESLSLDIPEWHVSRFIGFDSGSSPEGIGHVQGFTPSGEPYRTETFTVKADDETNVEVLVEAYPYLEDGAGNLVSPPTSEYEFLAVRLANPAVVGTRVLVGEGYWGTRDERYYSVIDRVEFGDIDLPADGTPTIQVVHEGVYLHLHYKEVIDILLTDDYIIECVGERCRES